MPSTFVAHLRSQHTSVAVAVDHVGAPFVAHWGADLGDIDMSSEHSFDARAFSRGILGGGLDVDTHCGLVAQSHYGWTGAPGVVLRVADGESYEPQFEFNSGTAQFSAALSDSISQSSLHINIEPRDSGVFVATASFTNESEVPVHIDALRLSFPVGAHAQEILQLGGRHGMEAVQQRTPWGRTTVAIENRSGRTSHENLGVVFVGTEGFGEHHGEVWAAHIAWSGNYAITCDGVTQAMHTIQIGELLQPGEITVLPGHTYTTPEILLAHSTTGLTDVSRKFHREMRSRKTTTHRPVVLNTWEAVYFNHDSATLTQLANVAAEVGIERFVLDDGWFHNRRNDTAGLGDWQIDTQVWPDGLAPLISHVQALGMEFGLWFEPEMVNPNSDVFRAHPEWALHGTHTAPVLGRNQLVLDLSRADVREYLFDCMHELLTNNHISYVKWDHNRPLIGGRAHVQTRGAYELFARLTAAHPDVQFESCASGGGRIDFGIAEYVDRFWASDSIDSLDRLSIQKGLSTFIPMEMLGSHIGSPTCHMTGRKHALSFRASTALFGWLGVEWNLLTLADHERERLSNAIALHKKHRTLLHTGDIFRSDHVDPTMHVLGVIATDKNEAILSVSRLRSGPSNYTAPVVFHGLHPHANYHVSLIPLGAPRYALHRALPEWLDGGIELTGQQLSVLGLNMPSLMPESTLLFHIVDTATQRVAKK